MQWRPYKYLSPILMLASAWISFHSTGWMSFLTMYYAFGFIPLAELFFKANPNNLDAAEEEMAKNDRSYDFILYLMLPLHYGLLFIFLQSFITNPAEGWTLAGRIVSMGILCGVFGINVAHELGHRATTHERAMAKALLLTSLYMHFYIEHNKGHHKRVATPDDPASARYGESIFQFYLRCIAGSYMSAWEISNREMKKKGLPILHIQNEMLRFHVIQLLFLVLISLLFGIKALLGFITAAIIGICLLEAVNYIEHYGLSRKEIGEGKYERAMPVHSWNSNHPIGRIMLFELSRHSDHHYLASRKYQVLRHHEDAPQMPTGYPGMMVLAHFPPLWFKVMHRTIERLNTSANNTSQQTAVIAEG